MSAGVSRHSTVIDKSQLLVLAQVTLTLGIVTIGVLYVALGSLLRHGGLPWGFTEADSVFFPWTQKRFLQYLLLGRLNLPVSHPARDWVRSARLLLLLLIFLLVTAVALVFFYSAGIKPHAG